ncbi:MAG: FAD/NAD(P)-binding protein [Acidimicrobiales bacterium]
MTTQPAVMASGPRPPDAHGASYRRGASAAPLTPAAYCVVARRVETSDVVTIAVSPLRGTPPPFAHGQFNMVGIPGIGEVPISISSSPSRPDAMEHTVRDVGAITHALCEVPVGGTVGLRGPFGVPWPLPAPRPESRPTADVVVVAGGIGLAPLRGAVEDLVERQARGEGRVFIFAGARSPDQIVFREDLVEWRSRGAVAEVTVDSAGAGWAGHVGVVTSLLDHAGFDPTSASALVCGPEVMMRFTARALVAKGIAPRRISLSLERNMQCGCGLCGHCQLGPLLLCRDGPVVQYAGMADRLLDERER